MAYNGNQAPPYPGGYAQPPPPGFNPNYGGQQYGGQQQYGQQGQQGNYGQQQGSYGTGAPPPFAPPPFAPPPHMSGGMAYVPGEAEAGYKTEFGFDDKTIRRGFIRKVFAIVTVQLLFVTGLIALFVFNEAAGLFVRRHSYLYWVSYAVFVGTYLALACCPSVRRSFPGNVICLAALTGAMGYMAAMISSMYETEIVFMSMGICAVCCFCIILFASQTKFDFTKLMGVMFVIFIIVFIFGFISIILVSTGNGSRILLVVYSSLMALVFMVYLAIDIQMLMGGKKYEMSPEDYVFAAAQIFLDIVNIFLLLLNIVGYANN